MPHLVRTVVLAVLLAAPAVHATEPSPLDLAVEKATPRATELRHRIRQNPELGNREFETAKLVAAHLKGLGYAVRTGVAKTGVVATLKGGRPGPCVALRADMDALPVTEQSGLPFASTSRTTWAGQDVGVAHVCGHDGHTAILMGVAEVFAEMRERIPGTVVFIFQPAEEGGAGGQKMVQEGLFTRFPVDAVYGVHNDTASKLGEIEVMTGSR